VTLMGRSIRAHFDRAVRGARDDVVRLSALQVATMLAGAGHNLAALSHTISLKARAASS
jgi:hypothetical protein